MSNNFIVPVLNKISFTSTSNNIKQGDTLFCGIFIFNMATFFIQQHEKICEFPSKQFYKGNLKTEKSKAVEDPAKEIWPVQDSPIVFCHVGDGVEEKLTHSMEEGHELSRKNKAEVDQVVR